MTRRTLGTALVVVGGALASVGVAGQVAGWGEGGSDLRAMGSPSGVVPSPAGEEAPQPELGPEEVKAFVAALSKALTDGDEEFLFDHLHPEVVAVYGTRACRRAVGGLAPSIFVVVDVRGPEVYRWEADGVARKIPGTYTVRVETGEDEVEIHVGVVGASPTWFTDCGTPLPGAA